MQGTRRQNAFVVGVWPTRRLVVFDTLAAEGPSLSGRRRRPRARAHAAAPHGQAARRVPRRGRGRVRRDGDARRSPPRGLAIRRSVPVAFFGGLVTRVPFVAPDSDLRAAPVAGVGGLRDRPATDRRRRTSAARSVPRTCSASGSRGTRWGSRCSCGVSPCPTSPTSTRAGSRGCCSRPTGASPTGSPGCARSRCRPLRSPDHRPKPARPSPTSDTPAGSRTRCRARSCVPPT